MLAQFECLSSLLSSVPCNANGLSLYRRGAKSEENKTIEPNENGKPHSQFFFRLSRFKNQRMFAVAVAHAEADFSVQNIGQQIAADLGSPALS